MGIFSRTRDIIAANMTDLLDRAEDPAKMIRHIIMEMEETLIEVRASAARPREPGMHDNHPAVKPLHSMNSGHSGKAGVALCAFLCLAGGSAAHAQTPKIGTVDIGKVFSAYHRTKEVEKTVLDSQAAAKRELEERLEKRRQLLEAAQSLTRIAEVSTPSAGARSDLQKQREEKAGELRQIEKGIGEFRATRSRRYRS